MHDYLTTGQQRLGLSRSRTLTIETSFHQSSERQFASDDSAHGVDRIEQMGSDAVVVGTDGKDPHLTSVRLGDWPEMASRYTRKAASQGELGVMASLQT